MLLEWKLCVFKLNAKFKVGLFCKLKIAGALILRTVTPNYDTIFELTESRYVKKKVQCLFLYINFYRAISENMFGVYLKIWKSEILF